MDCILICILFKFGEYICYSSRDLGFFLWVTFFGARAPWTCFQCYHAGDWPAGVLPECSRIQWPMHYVSQCESVLFGNCQHLHAMNDAMVLWNDQWMTAG